MGSNYGWIYDDLTIIKGYSFVRRECLEMPCDSQLWESTISTLLSSQTCSGGSRNNLQEIAIATLALGLSWSHKLEQRMRPRRGATNALPGSLLLLGSFVMICSGLPLTTGSHVHTSSVPSSRCSASRQLRVRLWAPKLSKLGHHEGLMLQI